MRSLQRVALSTLLALLGVAPAAADGTHKVVSLEAPDGTALKASYFAADKPGPGLLLLHQCNRDRTAWAAFAARAAARGIHVLTLDYRGYGESGGQRFENYREQGPVMQEKWPGDVDAAFAYLVSQPGVDKNRIGAAGASCGVNQAVQLARRHPGVRTVVLLSGNLQPDARAHIRSTPSMPVFTAASLDDGNIVQTMRWIKELSSHPASRYVEYKAAGHGTDMFAVEKGLEPAMLEWFETHLLQASSTLPAPPQAAGPKSPADQFWTALETPGGAAKAREIYDAAKKSDTSIVLFLEGDLNLFGYQVLQEGRTEDAIIIFRMNVDEYPKSANVYDSLSDAYLAAGNKAEALKYAEKAIEMLAVDTQATEEFKQQIRESAGRKIAELKKKE